MQLDQLECIEKQQTHIGRYLEFLIGSEVYGIPIELVTEIIGMQPINTLPETPKYIKGIINLRGRIIPVFDMHSKLNKSDACYTERTCIIVAQLGEVVAGLIVDGVNEVIDISNSDIVPASEIKMTDNNGCLKGIGKINGRISLILNYEKLFNNG